MAIFTHVPATADSGLTLSQLHVQDDVCLDAFDLDLRHAKSLVVIESPFITRRRIARLLPTLKRLQRCGVKVIVNTKPYEGEMVNHSINGVAVLQDAGVTVLMTGGHHRKISVIGGILDENAIPL